MKKKIVSMSLALALALSAGCLIGCKDKRNTEVFRPGDAQTSQPSIPNANTACAIVGTVAAASVSGQSVTSSALAGATVTVGTTSATTDAAGAFRLEVESGTYAITVSKAGYYPVTFNRRVTSKQMDLGQIALLQKSEIQLMSSAKADTATAVAETVATADGDTVTFKGTGEAYAWLLENSVFPGEDAQMLEVSFGVEAGQEGGAFGFLTAMALGNSNGRYAVLEYVSGEWVVKTGGNMADEEDLDADVTAKIKTDLAAGSLRLTLARYDGRYYLLYRAANGAYSVLASHTYGNDGGIMLYASADAKVTARIVSYNVNANMVRLAVGA